MSLTPDEEAFVEKRRKLARSWPLAGSVMLAALGILTVWLWISTPLLINPWAVFAGLSSKSIPGATLMLMASFLPVVVLACLLILASAVLLAFVAFSNERKHIAIIRRLTDPGESGPAGKLPAGEAGSEPENPTEHSPD
jgi:hypothetical protein